MLPIYNDNIQGKYSETLEAIGDLLIDLQDAAFNEGVKHANDWVSVEDELPPPGLTQYSCYGKDFRNTDIPFYYAARYHGDTIGWSIPGVSGLPISHWNRYPLEVSEIK